MILNTYLLPRIIFPGDFPEWPVLTSGVASLNIRCGADYSITQSNPNIKTEMVDAIFGDGCSQIAWKAPDKATIYELISAKLFRFRLKKY